MFCQLKRHIVEQEIISDSVSVFEEAVGGAGEHVIGEREVACQVAQVAYIAIHAPEDMVIARAGMGGVNEDLHGGYRIVFLAEQPAVVIAETGEIS
ncbi:MAG: hypothetical protein IKO26_05410 [Paludibacteraceae bacterium]|nr:hypothetical protein [Paludibacteraceae bacterium]